MSLSGISFSGLASGLDSRAIIDALLAVERRPIRALEQKKNLLSQSKNLFNDLQTKIEKLRDAAGAIKDLDSFLKFTASTSDEDQFFTVEAGESASPGTYDLHVESLAKATIQVSTGNLDKDTTTVVDATPFTFTFGDGHTLQITPSGALTLEKLAGEINSAESAPGVTQTDVRATVLDTGVAGPNQFKLVVTSLNEGTDAGFTVAGDNAGSQTATFFTGMTNNSAENTVASNAIIKISGVSVTRPSNTIADAIQGVTFKLKGLNPEGSGNATNVSIVPDASGTKDKINEFIGAYNEVIDFVKAQNELATSGTARGPLFGDVTLRQIRSSLRNELGRNPVATGNPEYTILKNVGIDTDTDGRLTLTDTEFTDALADDPNAVKRLFSDQSAGKAGLVFTYLDDITDSVDGLFKARLDGFDRQIRSADLQIEEKERRLEEFEERQLKRFAALESLISQLQSQGGSFAAFAPR